MQVTISDQHVEVTDTLRENIRQKLTRIDRHFSQVIRSHVVLDAARNRHRIETTVHTQATQWHVTAKDKDMYVTIDRVVDKLDRQAIKHKEKVVDHHQEERVLQNHPDW
jgi:putative sigma-54 modulation protein